MEGVAVEGHRISRTNIEGGKAGSDRQLPSLDRRAFEAVSLELCQIVLCSCRVPRCKRELSRLSQGIGPVLNRQHSHPPPGCPGFLEPSRAECRKGLPGRHCRQHISIMALSSQLPDLFEPIGHRLAAKSPEFECRLKQTHPVRSFEILGEVGLDLA